MEAKAQDFGDPQTILATLAEATREKEHLKGSYKQLGYIFDPVAILKSAKEIVQSMATSLRNQKATVVQAVARQLQLQAAFVIDVKGRKDTDEDDDDDNTSPEASPEINANGDVTSNLHILLSSAVLEVPRIDFVDYTETDRKPDQQLATLTLQLLLRFEICSVLRKSGDKEFGLGRHRDMTTNIAYSLAERLRDHRFEPRFFNEILKANYGNDSSDLSDFTSIFFLPEESTSEDDERTPHKPTAKHRRPATVVVTTNPKATGGQRPAAKHQHRATVVVTKYPKATGGQQPAALFSGIPQGAPRHQQMGTKMLEDKRLGAVLFRGPNGSDKAAGTTRTADGQPEGSANPDHRGNKRRAGPGTPQSRRKWTPPESNEINEDNDEDAIPGTVPPKQPLNMPRFSAMTDDMQPSTSKAAKSLFEAVVSGEPPAPVNQEKNVRKNNTWLRDATTTRPPPRQQRHANPIDDWMRDAAIQPPQLQLQAEQTDANPWAWAHSLPQPLSLLPLAAQAPSTSQGAANQGSLRGPALLERLAENLQQPDEPLPDMDVNDAPVQDEDCAKPQCEDGGPGPAAGEDVEHHTDMPSSPPSHAHLPELSVVPDTPLDANPSEIENSGGEEAGCAKAPVIMVATAEARQLLKPLEGDSQHNATREAAAAPSSQPAQGGGQKSKPRRSRKTTKGVTPPLQLADAPVPPEERPAQQPQPRAAAGKRKRDAATGDKRSKRNKADKPKEPNSQAGPAHSARVARSAASRQPEPESSSRPVTRSQARAGQRAQPAPEQPAPSSSRVTRSQSRADCDSEATAESSRRRRKGGKAGKAAAASSSAQRRLPRKPAARKAPAPSRSSQAPSDGSGEGRGMTEGGAPASPAASGEAAAIDNPLRRLSTIAEAPEEAAAAAAVATGPAGGASVDLISPGTAAAAANLALMRGSMPAPPAQERQGWRGGFRRPNWAALGPLSPLNPQAAPEGAEGGARRSKRLAERPVAAAKRPREPGQGALEGEAAPPLRHSGRQTRPSRRYA